MEKKKLTTIKLTTEQRKLVKSATTKIRGYQRKTVDTIIQIGQELIKVKDAVDHGNYLEWVKDELAMSAKTSQNYKNVAENLAGKSETIAQLPLALIYRIAALKIEDRESILAMITDSKKPPREEIEEKVMDLCKSDKVVPLAKSPSPEQEERDVARREQEQQQIGIKKAEFVTDAKNVFEKLGVFERGMLKSLFQKAGPVFFAQAFKEVLGIKDEPEQVVLADMDDVVDDHDEGREAA